MAARRPRSKRWPARETADAASYMAAQSAYEDAIAANMVAMDATTSDRCGSRTGRRGSRVG